MKKSPEQAAMDAVKPSASLQSLPYRLQEIAEQMRQGHTVAAYELLRQTQEFVAYELTKK